MAHTPLVPALPPTFRVINITEKRSILTGLSKSQAYFFLYRFREDYKDSKWTLGPDATERAS